MELKRLTLSQTSDYVVMLNQWHGRIYGSHLQSMLIHMAHTCNPCLSWWFIVTMSQIPPQCHKLLTMSQIPPSVTNFWQCHKYPPSVTNFWQCHKYPPSVTNFWQCHKYPPSVSSTWTKASMYETGASHKYRTGASYMYKTGTSHV